MSVTPHISKLQEVVLDCGMVTEVSFDGHSSSCAIKIFPPSPADDALTARLNVYVQTENAIELLTKAGLKIRAMSIWISQNPFTECTLKVDLVE